MAGFTAGNIVVYRVGAKGSSTALSAAASAVFLDEYAPDGTLVQSIAMPTADAGANQTLTAAGNSTTEGMLTRSVDGRYLVLTGYDAAVGTATVASTTTSAVTRVIGRIGIDGSADTTTTTTSYSGGAIRGAVTIDGTRFWETGSNGGVVSQTFQSTGAATSIAATPANDRAINIYGGQLYISSGSSPYVGVNVIGTGTPTTGGQTATLLTGSNATNPYQFYFADLNPNVAGVDTLYVADGTAANGLEKFSYDGTSWALVSKLGVTNNAGAAVGLIGLTGAVDGSGNARLYFTSGANLYTVQDTGGSTGVLSGGATRLATADTNTAFRGAAFAPQVASAETIAFQTGSVSHAEGSGTDTTYSFTLVRSGSTTAAATVAFAIQSGAGTTTDATDFTGATSGTATFASGSSTATVTITVAGDKVIEGDESFVLALASPSSGYALGTAATATGTILNDDLGGTFTIAATGDATEGGNATFTVSRTGGDGGPVDVAYTVSGATSGAAADATDFGGSFPSGVVRFAAGQTSATISIATSDDTIVEGDEGFTVTLGTPGAGSLGTASSAAAKILASDPAGTVSVADVTVDEGAGTATITLTRTGGSGDVTVGYQTANGTATAGSDYTAVAGTASFVGDASTATFTVPITNDNAVEGDETFTVTLTAGTGNPAIGRGTATVTITDNDVPAAVGSFALGAATASVAEGATGTTAITFTVTRTDGSAGAASVPYSVSFTGDHPADTADFASGQAFTGTVAFADGDTATKTITLLVQGDAVVESDETFTLALGTPSAGTLGTQTSAVGTIRNDDASFAIAAGSGNEGAGVPLVVTRTGDLSQAATLAWTAAIGAGDTASADDFPGGTLPSGTVSFAAGAGTATILLPVADDSTIERDETVTVTLSGAGANQTIATASAIATILNDDFPSLSVGNASVIEGDSGTTTLVFTVTASSAAPAGGISFQASTADGTATAGSDYTALSDRYTIAAGETSTTVSVTVAGDTVFERNETLSLILSSPTGATIASGTATGTIVNDEPVPASARLFATDFANFAAAGFAPGATAASGQLDSNIWRVVGLSAQPNPAYGFTGPAGNTTAATDDFGRGIISGDPGSAGVYTPAGNRALIVQPTGAELEAGGFIEARIQNTSGATATSFDVAFDWAYRNNAARSSNLQLAYSTDGSNFTTVSAASFATPGTADNTSVVFTNQAEAVTITGTVADGGYLYLRWIHASSAGSGSRDEVGIDNLVVDARLSSTPTASIADISVTEGDSGERFATFTVTRSNGTTSASVGYATVDGSAVAGRDYGATSGTLEFAVGEVSKTIQVAIVGDTVREGDERFQLVLSNPVGFAVPQPRATATILNDDSGAVAIYDIQGLGHTSPFAGQTVATYGVVTALASNGFYLQDAVGDGLVGTSDGIFVFTDTAPTVAVGNAITLSGTVAETRGHTGALTFTQLNTPTAITVTQASAPLPAATIIATDGSGRAAPTQVIDDDGLTSYDPTTDGIDFYESLEGMLVTVKTPRVVADTTSVGITYVVASDGVGATGLNSRSGMTISAGDANPETIQIFRNASASYHQGDTLNDVTGVMTYFSSSSTSSGAYQINPTVTTTVLNDVAHPAREATTLAGTATALSYASFNVENLAPVPDSTVTDRNTQDKVDLAFARHATEVVNALRSPDVIGLQEIQDADGIGTGTDLSGYATAMKLIAAIEAAGGPTYRYVEVTPTASTGGEPGGFIRPGFLYNPARVTYVEGSAKALTDAIFDGTRRPLIADFQFNGQTFTAIDMHSTSRGGSSPLYGSTQPPTQAGDGARTAQAQAVKAYVDGVLAGDANHLFMVNGDFNGFYYETALEALAPSSNAGTLANLITKLPSEERYTYYFDGYYQSFDNVIVSQRLYAGSSIDVVHYNAGYNDGLSATDHDQPVALIGLARSGGTATAIADAFATTAAALYRGTVLTNDTGGDTGLVVTALNDVAGDVGHAVRLASGALVTVLAGGTFAYDPDGAFATLAAGTTTTDSFRYTISGGSTATATITITGVATATPDASGHLNGSSGNDTLGGTTNADYFDLSSGGIDTVSGGAGADGFFFGGALTAADRVNGGSGMDQVGLSGDYTGANRLVLGTNTLTNVELIAALPGHSYDIVLSNGVIGDAGTFTAYGTNLAAGDAFTVDGSAVTSGPLTMFGGLGTDTLTGGSGNDGFFFGPDRWGANDVVHGGAGNNDQLALDGSYTIALDSRMDVEVLSLLAGSNGTTNTFSLTVADSFVTAGGSKTIFALPVTSSLTIDASGETDGRLTVYAGKAADTITGSAGADTIFGGTGGDTLRGGAGADTFLYDSAGQSSGLDYDRLLDFDYGSDTIRIMGQTHDTYQTVAGGQLNDASFAVDLQAAVGAQLQNGAAVFFTATSGDHAGQTFLIVDADGVAGYQTGGDYVFQMAAPPPAQVTDFIIA